MIPSSLFPFIVATLGASASFIGLLFVAVTFISDADQIPPARRRRQRILIEGAYAALINLFFISFVSLIPGVNVGLAYLALGIFGCASASKFARHRGGLGRQSWVTLAIFFLVYLLEAAYGLYVTIHANKQVNISIFTTFALILFGMALARSWEIMQSEVFRQKEG